MGSMILRNFEFFLLIFLTIDLSLQRMLCFGDPLDKTLNLKNVVINE